MSVGEIRIHVAVVIGLASMTVDEEIEIRANREPKPLGLGNCMLDSLESNGTHQKKSVDDRVHDTNGTAE